MILLNWLMGHLKAESMLGTLFLQNLTLLVIICDSR